MKTETEATVLRNEAQRCRQGALRVESPEAQRILLSMAAEYDAIAAAMDVQGRPAVTAARQGDAAPRHD